MEQFIYLDQNTLSDLRPRILNDKRDSQLEFLKDLILSRKLILLYSYVHLIEIHQIPYEHFQNEHIKLLDDLKSVYIEPLGNNLNFAEPSVIWSDYLDNKKGSYDNPAFNMEKLCKKLSGIPINENLNELNDSFKEDINSLLNQCLDNIESLDEQEIRLMGFDNVSDIEEFVNSCKEKMNDIKPLEISDEKSLGPLPFRAELKNKQLELSKVAPENVISTIIDSMTSNDQKSFNYWDITDGSVDDKIAHSYQLMNWAGYHADDFTKIKKKKDRFRASHNDLMHVQQAKRCNFLVSKDNAFRKKAIACYKYLGIPVEVVTPELLKEIYL